MHTRLPLFISFSPSLFPHPFSYRGHQLVVTVYISTRIPTLPYAVQDCSVHLSVNLLMRTSAHHGCWVFLSRRGACSYVLVRHPPKDETAEAFGSVTRMVYTTSPTLSASIQAGGTSARPPAVSATTGDGLSVWPSSAICSKGTCGVVMGCTVQCTVSATFYAYVKRAIAGVLGDGGPFH